MNNVNNVDVCCSGRIKKTEEIMESNEMPDDYWSRLSVLLLTAHVKQDIVRFNKINLRICMPYGKKFKYVFRYDICQWNNLNYLKYTRA